MKTVLSLLFGATIQLLSGLVLAQQVDPCPSGSNRERARCYYAAATQATTAGQTVEAIRLYQLAFAQSDRCELLVNIGILSQNHAALNGDVTLMRQAVTAFERARAQATCSTRLSAEDQTATAARLTQANEWLARHQAPVATPPVATPPVVTPPMPPVRPARIVITRRDYEAFVRGSELDRRLGDRVMLLGMDDPVAMPDDAYAEAQRFVEAGRERQARSLTGHPPYVPVHTIRPTLTASYILWIGGGVLTAWGGYSLWASFDASDRGIASGDGDRGQRASDTAVAVGAISLGVGVTAVTVGTLLHVFRPTRQVRIWPRMTMEYVDVTVSGSF